MSVSGEARRFVTDGLITTISPNDQMFDGADWHYFYQGYEGMSWIRRALRMTGNTAPHKVLDLPCGHGRIQRFIRAAFPEAEITACDLNRDGVDFCAETFRARPVYSREDPTELEFDDEFDLVYCGSLFTHLDEAGCRGFLELFDRCLSERGVLLFTTNGLFTVELLEAAIATKGPAGPASYGDDTEAKRDRLSHASYFVPRYETLCEMLDSFERTGFGYGAYDKMPRYGQTVSSPAWIARELERFPRLKLVLYAEQGMDTLQDMVACDRRPELHRPARDRFKRPG